LDEIIQLADYHTLAVELLAKTQRALKITANEFLVILKDKGFTLAGIREKITFSRHNKQPDTPNDIFVKHLVKVYDIADFENTALAEELRILQLMSLLAFEPVVATELREWLGLEDWDDFNNLIDKGWLIEKKEDSQWQYLMHPVISAVIQDQKMPDFEMTKHLVTVLATRLTINIGEIFTSKFPFMPHALSVAKCFEEETGSWELANLFYSMANIYADQANYTRALKWFKKSFEICETVLGKEHTDTAAACNSIATIYSRLGEHFTAMDWYTKTMNIQKKALGNEHPFLAITYNNIAGILLAQVEVSRDQYNKYCEVLKWLMKALGIREKTLRKALKIRKTDIRREYTEIAMTYNSFGIVYQKLGDYPSAMEWHMKALDIRKKFLGKEHPDTVLTYNHIAAIYINQDKYCDALKLLKMAVRFGYKVLGTSHPHTHIFVNNAKDALEQSGHEKNFEEWLEETLAEE